MDLVPVEEKNEIEIYKKKNNNSFLKLIISVLKLLYEILKVLLFISILVFVVINYKNIFSIFSYERDIVFFILFIAIPLLCYFIFSRLFVIAFEFFKSMFEYLFKPRK